VCHSIVSEPAKGKMENRKIRYQFDRLPIVLFLACLVVSVVADLKRGDDKGENRIVPLMENYVLRCISSNNSQIVWKKRVEGVDKNVKDIHDEKHPKKYEVKASEGVLVIEKFNDNDVAIYTCSVGSQYLTFNVIAEIKMKLPSDLFAVEGEKMEIVCTVQGTYSSIHWEYRNASGDTISVGEPADDDDEQPDIVTELKMHPGGVVTSKLVKNQTTLSDRGYYICIVENPLKQIVKFEGLLHVKDKLAALWPFLGICAEVFILCAIILIYEKRRNKTEQEDSDTDQPEQKK
jgi:hypothetical protein